MTSSYDFVALGMNGRRHKFVEHVRVLNNVVMGGQTIPGETLFVNGKIVSMADSTPAMRDGHLAALGQWIESDHWDTDVD